MIRELRFVFSFRPQGFIVREQVLFILAVPEGQFYLFLFSKISYLTVRQHRESIDIKLFRKLNSRHSFVLHPIRNERNQKHNN